MEQLSSNNAQHFNSSLSFPPLHYSSASASIAWYRIFIASFIYHRLFEFLIKLVAVFFLVRMGLIRQTGKYFIITLRNVSSALFRESHFIKFKCFYDFIFSRVLDTLSTQNNVFLRSFFSG